MAQTADMNPAPEELVKLVPKRPRRLSGLVEGRSGLIVLDCERDRRNTVPARPVQETPRQARRRSGMDWYDAGVLLLLVSSALAALVTMLTTACP
jgi:hypothetical protein